MTTPAIKLDSFTLAYIECALFSSLTDDDTPMDQDYSRHDIADETLAKIVADCERFQTENDELITEENALRYGPDCNSASARAGHDFWLTRNGHGAGFWDGDWEESAGKKLTEAAHAFGECNLYVGDDGKVYA
jgi:hypothetical protein